MNFLDERLPDRFWRKCIPDPMGGCWLWIAALNKPGYGQISIGHGRIDFAHRVSYRAFVGDIPDNKDLDHRCRVRSCCNPAHLEPVSRRENLLRGETIPATLAARTHCDHGHEFTVENTRLSNGYRSCRECNKTRCLSKWHGQTDESRLAYNSARRTAYRARKGGAL